MPSRDLRSMIGSPQCRRSSQILGATTVTLIATISESNSGRIAVIGGALSSPPTFGHGLNRAGQSVQNSSRLKGQGL